MRCKPARGAAARRRRLRGRSAGDHGRRNGARSVGTTSFRLIHSTTSAATTCTPLNTHRPLVSVTTNCTANSATSAIADHRWKRSAMMIATPSTVCDAVSTNSSTCRPSSGSPPEVPPPSTCAIGSEPTSSDHWFTFDAMSVPIAAPPMPRSAKSAATMNSGASVASGASHCTRK